MKPFVSRCGGRCISRSIRLRTCSRTRSPRSWRSRKKAGLDTFAQRKPGKQVFEIDRPETQAWKRQRLVDLGLPAPTFVPVDFEKQDWWEELVKAGFDPRGRSIVSSLGVSMYITKEATKETLERIAKTPATLILSFIVPMDLVEESERPMFEIAQKGTRASGTPMIAFYAPDQMLALAREAGFGKVEHVSGADLARLYFADRPDGLRPPLMGESLVVASI